MSRAFWRLCDARHAFARCGNASSHNLAVLSLIRSRNFDPCSVCSEKVSLHIFALDTGSSRTVGRYRSALIVWNVKETQNICWERLAVMEFAPRDWRCPRHTHTLLHSFWLFMLGIIHPPSGRHLGARELFAIVQSPEFWIQRPERISSLRFSSTQRFRFRVRSRIWSISIALAFFCLELRRGRVTSQRSFNHPSEVFQTACEDPVQTPT